MKFSNARYDLLFFGRGVARPPLFISVTEAERIGFPPEFPVLLVLKCIWYSARQSTRDRRGEWDEEYRLAGLGLLLALGCGGETGTDEPTETDSSVLSEQFGNTADAGVVPDEPSIPEPVDFGMVIEEKNTDLTEEAYRVFFNQFIPEGCSSDAPCPLLVLVADTVASGTRFSERRPLAGSL